MPERRRAGGRSRLSELTRYEAVLARIQALGQGGHSAAAIRLAEQTLSRMAGMDSPDAAVLKVRIQTNLASNLVDTGKLSRAMDLLDAALQAAPAQSQAILASRGFIRFHAGHLDLALADLTAAIEGPALPDGRAHFAALLNRGLLYMDRGRLAEAGADTRAAVEVAVATSQPDNELMARHNLAYLKYLYGDLPGALAEMDSAENASPGTFIGVPALDRSRVLLAGGLFAEAQESVAVAVADFRRNKAGTDLADALLLSADLDIAAGATHSALRKARRSEQLRARLGNDNAALVARVTTLRARWPKVAGSRIRRVVLEFAAEAAAVGEQLGTTGLSEDSAASCLLAAQGYLAANQVQQAREITAQITRTAGRSSLPVRLHAKLLAGRIALADGHPGKALTELRKGLDDLADFQARFGSQELQSGSAVHGSELAKLGLRTAIEGGSPASILQWLERGRAVSTRLPAVHPPADEQLAELLGALRYASTRAREAMLAGRPDRATQAQIADLRRQIRARSWIVSGTGSADRPLHLAQVRRLLAVDPDNPTIVALITGLGAVRALVITARGAWFQPLGDWDDAASRHRRRSADLDMLAGARVAAPLRKVARASVLTELKRLSEQLLNPILSRFTDGPVLVAAVGELATLPWNLLPALAGRPVSVSSSVTSAMASSGRPARAHLRGVLAVAGPEVPHGAKEAESVAALHQGAGLLTDDQATGEAVLAQLPAGGLLHVAAHGHHETESPLFSSVLLADGPLYGYDIAPNPQLPDHVVLSSCDVGRSDLRPGGEPLGLAAALLRSGVSTVVTGVSRISDSVALEVMAVYHQRLVAGDSPATALSSAVLAAGDELAAFNCFGSGA